MYRFFFLFYFILSFGGWGKIKLKITTLPKKNFRIDVKTPPKLASFVPPLVYSLLDAAHVVSILLSGGERST